MKLSWKKELKFYQHALWFILPICTQSLVETILGLMNSFVVGQLGGGDAKIAGVSSSSNIYDLVWFIFFAIVACGNIFLAQYLGANASREKIRETTNIKLFYVLIFSIFFVLLFQFFSHNIAELILSATEKTSDAVATGASYSRLISWNYPLLGFAYIISITMNAEGNIKTPLLVSISSLFINVTLVIILAIPYQGWPNLGITGLGISLIVTRAIECILLISYMVVKKPIYMPNLNIFKIPSELHYKYFKAFLPMFLSQIFFGFSLIIQTVMYAHYRDLAVVAAANVVSTTMAIFYSTFRGYNALVAYYVGRNLGNNQLTTAKENAKKILHMTLLISAVISILIIISAQIVPRYLFPNLTPEAEYVAIYYLTFSAITYFFINMLQPMFSFLYAGGYTLIVSVADLILIWVVDIFITFSLLQWTQMSIITIMLVSCLTKSIDFAFAYLLYKFVPWARNIVGLSNIKLEQIQTEVARH